MPKNMLCEHYSTECHTDTSIKVVFYYYYHDRCITLRLNIRNRFLLLANISDIIAFLRYV